VKAALVVVVVAVMAAAAPAARAQVAVSAAIATDDAAERDIAALVVREARARWDILSPPFTGNADAQGCKPGDNECLRIAAKKAGASHLLVVAVAPVGARDHIVAVQLFAVGVESALFEESVVQPGGTDADAKQVAGLAARLVQKSGPPPVKPASEAPVVDGGPSTAAWVGIGFVGAGLAAGAGTLITSLVLSAQHDPLDAGTASAVGISASCGLVVVGGTVMAADWLGWF